MIEVRVVALTMPVIRECETAEEFIAYTARVSNPENQSNKLTAPKLLNYCARKKHWSVFEISNVVMEVKTTRDIGRQILRHRSFSFQEFSQRYAEVTNFVKDKEARLQDVKNRQNSIELNDNELQARWTDYQGAVLEVATEAYSWALEQGIAKECARVVLPEGLTMTTMYMNGSVRSWIHYLLVRTNPDTQKEHRMVADAFAKELLYYFPTLKEVLENPILVKPHNHK
jgi:thymidylate synthase (FAD)